MEIDEQEINKDITPNVENKLNKTILGTNKGAKRKSTTPQNSSLRAEPRRRLSFGYDNYEANNKSFVPLDESNIFHDANLPPAGEDEIYGITSDKSPDKSEYMDISHTVNEKNEMDDSGELLRIFDDDLIGKNTLKQRLDAAPYNVRRKFLVNGDYPKRVFNITYYDTEKQQDQEMSINGYDVAIIRGNTLRINDRRGITKVYNTREDSLNKIRIF